MKYEVGISFFPTFLVTELQRTERKVKTERILYDRIGNIIVSSIMLKGGWRSAFIYNSIKGR